MKIHGDSGACKVVLGLIGFSIFGSCRPEEPESYGRQAVIDFYGYLASGELPLEFLPTDTDIASALAKRYPEGTDSRRILREFLLKHRDLLLHPNPDAANGLSRVMFVSPVFEFKRVGLPRDVHQTTSDRGTASVRCVVVAFFASEASKQAVVPINSNGTGGALIDYAGIRIDGAGSLLLDYALEEAEIP